MIYIMVFGVMLIVVGVILILTLDDMEYPAFIFFLGILLLFLGTLLNDSCCNL